MEKTVPNLIQLAIDSSDRHGFVQRRRLRLGSYASSTRFGLGRTLRVAHSDQVIEKR